MKKIFMIETDGFVRSDFVSWLEKVINPLADPYQIKVTELGPILADGSRGYVGQIVKNIDGILGELYYHSHMCVWMVHYVKKPHRSDTVPFDKWEDLEPITPAEIEELKKKGLVKG